MSGGYTLDEIRFDQIASYPFSALVEENAMWEKGSRTARLRIHALENMLKERIVGPALRRRPEEVACPLDHSATLRGSPFLDGVRRIGEDHVEGLEPVAFDQSRHHGWVLSPRADVEVGHAVQDEVHAGDGRGDVDGVPGRRGRWCGCRRSLRFTSARHEINMPPVPQVGSSMAALPADSSIWAIGCTRARLV